jgi:hypothetical protein
MVVMMDINNYNISKKIRCWIGWILRPHLSFLRIREMRHAKKARPVRNNLDVSALPNVTLHRAITSRDLGEVVDLYKRNPSQMVTAPRSMEAIKELLEKNVEFYKILNADGLYVGNTAYQADHKSLGFLTIDYSFRNKGLGLAATAALLTMLKERNIDVVYVHVFRDNRRSLSSKLSFGWEIVESMSTQRYITLKKNLISFKI